MLEYVYIATGILLIALAFQSFLDSKNPKRVGTGLFWFIYGITFCLGSFLPDWSIGLMVIALTLLASFGFMGLGDYKLAKEDFAQKRADKFKKLIFLPALLIPIITIAWKPLTGTSPLIGLGFSSVLSVIVAMVMTKSSVTQTAHEGRRLLDIVGWATILSQFLAALGYIFGKAGVGETVSQIVQYAIPHGSLFAYVLAYTFGMAIFTIIMGNAFAAFAVMTTGIALPLLIAGSGGNAIIVGVIGMLSGYCGTLMTPMAANFNIVPAALLELEDKNKVIKVQILPGFAMLLINSALMYFLAF